jgi:REP element-mobilizing transposase RayT
LKYARAGLEDFDVAVGRYVILPDHLHLFVQGGRNFVLGKWIKGLKRAVATALEAQGSELIWQPGFFDHLLRNDESYAQKWEYVRENPVRAGLVAERDQWPHQGEIVVIDRV